MVTTIQQALRPFFVICFVVGLGFYPMKRPRIWWIASLSILYSLTIWFTCAYLFYYIITLFTIKVLYNKNLVAIVVTKINIFTLIVSVIMSFYYQKKFTTCLKKLAIVDDTLKELGSPKTYKEMYKWSKGIVIMWIMCNSALNLYETPLWLDKKETASWGLYLPHVLNYPLHINSLVDLLFIFLLRYIGTRFDKIYEHIHYLVRQDHELKCTRKELVVAVDQYTYSNNYKRVLWISMHLHLELCHLARELNLIFGTQLTFEMASYFLYLTPLCYYLCMRIMKNSLEEIFAMTYDLFYLISWILLFIFKLYIINWICETVTVKANKNDKIIHQLTSIRQYADISEEIHQFTLQMMQHPLKFSGIGLFCFGNTCFQKFCTTAITYIIIMMQLEIT